MGHMRKRKNKTSERVRNIFLILLAVGVVVIFFNLDMIHKGESVFSKSADNKLNFTGDLKVKAYSKAEIERLVKYIKRHNEIIDTATVRTSVQDTSKKLTGKSQVTFEVNLIMKDGATISTPTRRSTRKELVSDILSKVNKDIRAYKKLIKEGKKVKSLVNTS